MFELTEIIKQKENSWGQLLRRSRVAKTLPPDYVRLNLLNNKTIPSNTPQVCRLSKVKSHNELVFSEFSGEKFFVEPVD